MAARLARILEERTELRVNWQARMRARLDHTRSALQRLRGIPGLRDEAAEADLAQQISLLEYEFALPPFGRRLPRQKSELWLKLASSFS
jgi:hypothetical protein